MRNLLFVYHVSTVGGGSLCLLNIIKELDRNKFNPIVLLKTDGKLSEELKKLGVVVYFDSRIRTVPYNRSLASIRVLYNLVLLFFSVFNFRRWVEKLDIDIVYLNTMMLYPYLIPVRKNCASVIHVREHWPKGEHIFQFNLARKVINNFASQVIAINETSKGIIGLPHKTQVIYDWISFEGRDGDVDFEKIFGKDYKSLFIFLYLGGMQRIKGALEIVESFSSLSPFDNARLLFVGHDKDRPETKSFKYFVKKVANLFGLKSYSQKVLKLINADERIKTIPYTSNVKHLILKSDIGVSFPTIPHAILPIAESVFLGKKIVTVDYAEAREYIGDAENAFLIKKGDKKGLNEAMKKALRELKTNNMIENKSIANKFSAKKNSEKLNNLIWDINVQR